MLFVGIVLFDANYVIHYSLVGLLGLIAYFHPSTASYLREIIIITNLANFMETVEQKMMEKKHETKYGVYCNKDV